ncbi:MAG: ATP synthase F1 subunit gamma [Chthoniobacteraceae bacterium]
MAANTRDIRRRIKSVKNTAQITKAMQMVAAAKMRKAQLAALAGRPYSDLLSRVLGSLAERVDTSLSPLLEVRPVKNELLLVISTDKGLCGALNTNLFREIGAQNKDGAQIVTAGRKASQFAARSRKNLIADFEIKDTFTIAETKAISKLLIQKFLSGEVDQVSVLSTKFINTLNQQPLLEKLLPLDPETLPKASAHAKADGSVFTFEPGEEEVLASLLPHYLHYQVYQKFLDARASEHSARMVAMKNATDNAKQLIKDLTLEYNKVRQAGITTELLEITTAQMAAS